MLPNTPKKAEQGACFATISSCLKIAEIWQTHLLSKEMRLTAFNQLLLV
jgi:hypothetical protein